MSDYQRISVEQAQRLLATENTMLLDMRDARAYCQGHDPRATRLSELNFAHAAQEHAKSRPSDHLLRARSCQP